MPWCAFVGYTSLVDHPIALGAALSKLLFIALNTNDVLISWYEAATGNRLTAYLTAEATLVPLLTHVFVLLHTSTKYMSALVASCSKIVVVAISTVELVVCCCKWLVNQRSLAVRAFEALLVPMCIFVRQIFGVCSNDSLAFLTGVSKKVLVALDAVGMFIPQNVPMASEIKVTVEAGKVTAVPILVHGLGVFSREYQLITCCTPWPN